MWRDPVRLGWRTALLAAARPQLLGSLGRWVDAELARLLPALEAARAEEPADAAQVALTSALAGAALGRASLESAARRATDRLLAATASAATAELAAVGFAAQCAGEETGAARIASELVARRLSDDRDALLARTAGGTAPEVHPWVGLLLLERADDAAGVAAVFDPQVPPLPAFSIVRADATPGALRFVVDERGTRGERVFEAADLDVLLDRALAQIEREEPAKGSPRQHGHIAIAAMLLAGRSRDEDTSAALTALVRRAVAEIVDRQAANGGWSYSHKHVKSTTYSPGRRDDAAFADRQYSLDAAVPGIALCAAYANGGGGRELAAAERAFAFFERSIRRVPWNGRRVWRLWPEDIKTPFMGTAVNYELWNAAFFAAVAQLHRDPRAVERARRYVRDAVDYAAALTTPEGDIAYGDYVDEKRTAYASWDALLLGAIADATGDARAAELSRRIVGRLAEVMDPSGALPNVVDHREEVASGRTRHAVHRHGIGPHPVRTYYQLYYTAAAALAGGPAEPALRALGFVLLHCSDPALAGVSAGTSGDGTPTPVAGGVPGRDWLLVALALLPRIADVDYRPARGNARPAGERLARVATGVLAGLADPGPDAPAEVRAAHRPRAAGARTRDGRRRAGRARRAAARRGGRRGRRGAARRPGRRRLVGRGPRRPRAGRRARRPAHPRAGRPPPGRRIDARRAGGLRALLLAPQRRAPRRPPRRRGDRAGGGVRRDRAAPGLRADRPLRADRDAPLPPRLPRAAGHLHAGGRGPRRRARVRGPRRGRRAARRPPVTVSRRAARA